MQFHIHTLLIVMAAVSLLCGVVFAAPPIVCLPVLLTVLWVCPAVWLNGIVSGRGPWRAFFIGGFIAGLGPHLGAVYYSVQLAAGIIEVLFNGDWNDLAAAEGFGSFLHAAILLAPGLFAFLGGLAGAITYWTLQPATKERAVGSLAANEYLVVSGRLTTTPVERQV